MTAASTDIFCGHEYYIFPVFYFLSLQLSLFPRLWLAIILSIMIVSGVLGRPWTSSSFYSTRRKIIWRNRQTVKCFHRTNSCLSRSSINPFEDHWITFNLGADLLGPAIFNTEFQSFSVFFLGYDNKCKLKIKKKHISSGWNKLLLNIIDLSHNDYALLFG